MASEYLAKPDNPVLDSSEMRAARLLAECRQNGTRIAGLPESCVPKNLSQAYRIQSRTTELLGSPVVAYKIGLTNSAAQRAAGTDEPIVGCLATEGLLMSPGVISHARSWLKAIEAEAIFRLGSNLPAREGPFSREHVLASVDTVYAGIEICDSRYIDSDSASIESVVADNSNAGFLVIGSPLPVSMLSGLPVTLLCGKKNPIVGNTDRVLGDPVNALCWLADWLAVRNIDLQRGVFVASGTCTSVTLANPNDCCVVDFGGLARAAVNFAP
jgi:2-keto-4-pentenoate hydratase